MRGHPSGGPQLCHVLRVAAADAGSFADRTQLSIDAVRIHRRASAQRRVFYDMGDLRNEALRDTLCDSIHDERQH